MDALEAHARFCEMQGRAGAVPRDEAAVTAPLIDTAFASLSGWLGDATDDASLTEAVEQGSSLWSCGVISPEDMDREVRSLMDQLAASAARLEGARCSTG